VFVLTTADFLIFQEQLQYMYEMKVLPMHKLSSCYINHMLFCSDGLIFSFQQARHWLIFLCWSWQIV